MRGNALYIQSGGPTAVINSSAYGVIREWQDRAGEGGTLYAAEHGLRGVLQGRFYDLSVESREQISLLLQTPSMAFGSCRCRIEREEEYERILGHLQKFRIRYLFLNGGNGSAKAGFELYQYLERRHYEARLIVIPKTVDNDISHIDHAPGFPSAARHVAITLGELARDIKTYDTELITVTEVMGRNTGFLAAAGIAAGGSGAGPDLIYVPEVIFEERRFLEDIEKVMREKGKCLAVVSEGVKTRDGRYLFEETTLNKAADPVLNMGGITPYLGKKLREHFTCKIRCIDLGLMQRCSSHTASKIDREEAVKLGRAAVKAALSGESGGMVSLRRISDRPYRAEVTWEALSAVVSGDQTLPLNYINPEHNSISKEFLDYIEPLIGELPAFSSLARKLAAR